MQTIQCEDVVKKQERDLYFSGGEARGDGRPPPSMKIANQGIDAFYRCQLAPKLSIDYSIDYSSLYNLYET